MIDSTDIEFLPLLEPSGETVVVLAGSGGELGQAAKALDEKSGGLISRAFKIAKFQGKKKSSVDLVAPAGLPIDRLIIVGLGKVEDYGEGDWLNLGGRIRAKLAVSKSATAGIVLQTAGDAAKMTPADAATVALGFTLRGYEFKKYKTKKADENGEDSNGGDSGKENSSLTKVSFHCGAPGEASKHYEHLKALGEGVMLARDLVNEPANILGPAEFAERALELKHLGLDVDVLDEEQLRSLGMNALLAVGQGSDRPTLVAVMRWQGAKNKRGKPLAFVGKGVCFDTGGISIKPAQGMEDMKGDMGGAACVTGLMLALAKRKAAINAVGVIGLVENMPGGAAQRPGDVVRSMSGQTIEVLNTDAEGRLVLADLLWFTQERYKPRFVMTLATLTGAIIIALGQEYAGLFSNDGQLAERLMRAGEETEERVWRLPLSEKYDKLIDSKIADMKNLGGRGAGSITAAQFLKRFVKDGMPWAHLDVAGTAFASPLSDINPSWGSGYGVRLLDRLISRFYEN